MASRGKRNRPAGGRPAARQTVRVSAATMAGCREESLDVDEDVPAYAVGELDDEHDVAWHRAEAQHAALAELRARTRMVVRVAEEQEQAVAEARALGVSWHRIGVVAHMTAEGARRRWGR